jgi:hypothetical protein
MSAYCLENLPSAEIYELLVKNVSKDAKLDRDEITVSNFFFITFMGFIFFIFHRHSKNFETRLMKCNGKVG